ncbi:hypothetical protein BS78_K110300 [Paspalum vaginatum]|uniref:Uncharacterized protein n=1 Tax=Paspalum vaginatum TaxID=158149 RepID=A0A9W8CDX3_9POAL|nr:hypothetical protein BS78_K110300 [Paspalum vaginatum]
MSYASTPIHNCFNSLINGCNITLSFGPGYSGPGMMRQRNINSYFMHIEGGREGRAGEERSKHESNGRRPPGKGSTGRGCSREGHRGGAPVEEGCRGGALGRSPGEGRAAAGSATGGGARHERLQRRGSWAARTGEGRCSGRRWCARGRSAALGGRRQAGREHRPRRGNRAAMACEGVGRGSGWWRRVGLWGRVVACTGWSGRGEGHGPV